MIWDLSILFSVECRIALVLFYIFKNCSKERLMLTSHESLILNYLSGSLFCRAETSTVYDEMVAWGQPSNSNAERLFLLSVLCDLDASKLKQRSEEGFSVCFSSFMIRCENNTNSSNDLWFEVSSRVMGGEK